MQTIKVGDTVWHRSNAYMHAVVTRIIWNYYAWIKYTLGDRSFTKVVRVKDLTKVVGE